MGTPPPTRHCETAGENSVAVEATSELFLNWNWAEFVELTELKTLIGNSVNYINS